MGRIRKGDCYIATDGSIHSTEQQAKLQSIYKYLNEKRYSDIPSAYPKTVLNAAEAINEDIDKFIKFLQEL